MVGDKCTHVWCGTVTLYEEKLSALMTIGTGPGPGPGPLWYVHKYTCVHFCQSDTLPWFVEIGQLANWISLNLINIKMWELTISVEPNPTPTPWHFLVLKWLISYPSCSRKRIIQSNHKRDSRMSQKSSKDYSCNVNLLWSLCLLEVSNFLKRLEYNTKYLGFLVWHLDVYGCWGVVW